MGLTNEKDGERGVSESEVWCCITCALAVDHQGKWGGFVAKKMALVCLKDWPARARAF
jgi:hypothetical protein